MATLTKQEKAELKEKGYSFSDIQEIVKGAKKTIYYLIADGNQTSIDENEAIERLGREEWLRGLARSSFHIGTNRYGLNGETVRMETRLYS